MTTTTTTTVTDESTFEHLPYTEDISEDMEQGEAWLGVVHALADAMSVDPLDMDPLYPGEVDPDLVDQMFGPRPNGRTPGNVVLTFYVHLYEVTITGDGTVEIDRWC